jgi:hypothetical protein
MHTSTLLTSADFAYGRGEAGDDTPADFAALFPDYHELDRVGVVSPNLEDGVLFTGASLLALTTAFYDVQRAKGGEFFNYPQHFALIGGAGDRVWTRQGLVPRTEPLLGYTYGNLDVWPDTNWIVAPPTAAGMLQQVFALQINRLFWPESLVSDGSGPPLPDYARSLLRSRLKSVVLYGTTSPTTGIRALPRAMDVLTKSRNKLPGNVPPCTLHDLDALHQIPTDEFLAMMTACFEEDESHS